MHVLFWFSDIDIVLILNVPKCLISMEVCVEQKRKMSTEVL